VEVRRVASPRIEETPARAGPEEAGASWGAPVEAKPQHAELELVTVTPGSWSVETATHTNIFDAAERIIDEALEEIAHMELAHLPVASAVRQARQIRQLERGMFYEVLVDWDGGWVERQVVRADKTFYYKKKTYLYFDDDIILVELEAVYIKGTLYYVVDVDDKKVLEIGRGLKKLLEMEGAL
jgi:hypothetical protein